MVEIKSTEIGSQDLDKKSDKAKLLKKRKVRL
jgi:hypothetical protein